MRSRHDAGDGTTAGCHVSRREIQRYLAFCSPSDAEGKHAQRPLLPTCFPRRRAVTVNREPLVIASGNMAPGTFLATRNMAPGNASGSRWVNKSFAVE